MCIIFKIAFFYHIGKGPSLKLVKTGPAMKMFSQMSNTKIQFNVINIPTAIETGF